VPETESPSSEGAKGSFSFMISRSDRNPAPCFVSQAGYREGEEIWDYTAAETRVFLGERKHPIEIQIPLCYWKSSKAGCP
jgi:hypothetical protein